MSYDMRDVDVSGQGANALDAIRVTLSGKGAEETTSHPVGVKFRNMNLYLSKPLIRKNNLLASAAPQTESRGA